MSDPIYEIPVLPPGANVDGWTPGIRRRSRGESSVDGSGLPSESEQGRRSESSYDPSEQYGFGSSLSAEPAPAEPEDRRAGAYESLTASTSPLYSAPAEAPTAASASYPAEQPAESYFTQQAPPSYQSATYPAPAGPASGQSELVRAMQEAAAAAGHFGYAQADAEPEPVVLREISLADALHTVVALKASDLHVTADAPPMIRVNGGLRAIEGASAWSREKINAELRAIANDRQLAMFEDNLELDFAHTLTEESRFRVNYYLQRGAIGAAFRLIPTEIKRLSDLGVPESVSHFATLPRGLVLVTGPTGSGKSTTLAGLIDLVNRTRADHIVTVEDPIEFMHKNQKSIVNQREVGADTHSFANALKHVLRQDPDVILIGELRDLETISVALTAAETGHLVFATLHTQDAAQTIDRVIDVFPSHQQDQVRTQLAGTLQGVVSQTLVPKASGSGRVVATEVMVITPALSNLIREGKTYQILSAMQAGRDLGMHTMDQHLAELVNSGKITAQAAKAKSHDPEGFQRMLHGSQSPTEAAARAMQASDIDYGDSYSSRLDR
ncbi:PilT/PilU family type 4a pilus ATPase [Mycetocola sp. 2940]|uniref:type IV pilus twitching motility protein PilT n=1 Tax=Mycetocola sp. 2940 TaxID=3156452 RepID=UPI003393D050